MAWYDPDPFVRRTVTFLAGVATGALLLGAAWVAWTWLDPRPPGVQEAGPSPDVLGVESTAGLSAAPCRAVFQQQTRPLEASAQAVRTWRRHLDTLDELAAGALSQEQVRTFWDRARVDVAASLGKWEAAQREFARRTTRCPPLPTRFPPAAEADTCPSTVAARAITLRRATKALATWQQQVDRLDEVMERVLTPEEAGAQWAQRRPQAVEQLGSYDTAVQRSQDKIC